MEYMERDSSCGEDNIPVSIHNSDDESDTLIGDVILSGSTDSLLSIALDTTGRCAVTGGCDETLRIYHIERLEESYSNENLLSAHLFDNVNKAEYLIKYSFSLPKRSISPDHIRVNFSDSVGFIGFSPKCDYLCVCSYDGYIRIYDCNHDFSILLTMDAPNEEVDWAVWKEDNTMVAVGSESCVGYIYVFSIPEGALTWIIGGGHDVVNLSCAFYDDVLITTDSSGEVRRWQDGYKINSWSSITHSKQEEKIQIDCGDEVDPNFEKMMMAKTSNIAVSCNYSYDGKYVGVGFGNGNVSLVDTVSGHVTKRSGVHNDSIEVMKFRKGTHILGCGSLDGTISVLNISQNFSIVRLGENDLIRESDNKARPGYNCFEWHPDPSFYLCFSAGQDGKIVLWDVAEGLKLASITVHPSSILGMTSFYDKNLRRLELWTIADGGTAVCNTFSLDKITQ